MKAIRVSKAGGPEVLQLEDVAEPIPGDNEVLVKVEAIGLNFIEVYLRKGLYPTALPFTPGTEGAGTVVRVGSGVENVHPGDRVASHALQGSYAEFAKARADVLVKLPDEVSARDGAASMLQGMTAHYLSHSVHRLEKGQRCLVHAAAGGVGLLLCQMAHRLGAHVIGTVSTEEKAALAREAGAEHVILYTEEDFVEATRSFTQGRGVHVVYDSVGATTFLKSLDCLVPRGMMALFGQSSGPVAPFDPGILNRKGSLFVTRPTLGNYVATREELEWRAGDVLNWIRDGSLKVRVDREVSLKDVADAHQALEARETTGKVVLVP